jgi:hypothetical protein
MKNTRKFGFRGSGTIIIFLVIIAFVFAAITACEGAVGAAGKPGEPGRNGAGGNNIEKRLVDGVEYWFVNNENTWVKADGLAELKITKRAAAPGVTPFKDEYLANRGLNMVGFNVYVTYNEPSRGEPAAGVTNYYEREVTDFILVWVKDDGKEVVLGRNGVGNRNGVAPDGSIDATKFFSNEPLASDGVKTLRVYGPAAQPAEFTITVTAFTFSKVPTLTFTTTASVHNYGDNITATFTVLKIDENNDDDIDSLDTTGSVKFQFYRHGVKYGDPRTPTSRSVVTAWGVDVPEEPKTTEGETLYSITIPAYAANGPYSVGVIASGFFEAKNTTPDLTGFQFELDDVTKLSKFMEESDPGQYTVVMKDTTTDSTIVMPSLRAAVLKGNESGVKVNLDLSSFVGAAATDFVTISSFEGCEALVGVILAGKVTTFPAVTFLRCPNLETISVVPRSAGGNVTALAAGHIFAEGDVLYKAVDVVAPVPPTAPGNIGGMVATKKELLCWPAKKPLTAGRITIDNKVTSVVTNAINTNVYLTNLEIIGFDSLLVLSNNAVTECQNLSKVTITQDVDSPNVVYTTPFVFYGDLNNVILTDYDGEESGVYIGRPAAGASYCSLWTKQ